MGLARGVGGEMKGEVGGEVEGVVEVEVEGEVGWKDASGSYGA